MYFNPLRKHSSRGKSLTQKQMFRSSTNTSRRFGSTASLASGGPIRLFSIANPDGFFCCFSHSKSFYIVTDSGTTLCDEVAFPVWYADKKTPRRAKCSCEASFTCLAFLIGRCFGALGARATAAAGAAAAAAAERAFLFSLDHSANREKYAEGQQREKRIIEKPHTRIILQSGILQTQPPRRSRTA